MFERRPGAIQTSRVSVYPHRNEKRTTVNIRRGGWRCAASVVFLHDSALGTTAEIAELSCVCVAFRERQRAGDSAYNINGSDERLKRYIQHAGSDDGP